MLNKLRITFTDKTREPFPDFLRGIAILMMIQVHITELLLRPEAIYHLYEKWSYFFGGIPAAPVFIVLMGYFQDRSKSSLIKEIYRGIKIFLLGIALNIMMNFSLIYLYLNNRIDVNILSYIFGIDILILAGFSYILIAIIKRSFKHPFYLFGLIIFIYTLYFFLKDIHVQSDFLMYLLSAFVRVSSWSYFPLIPWISFSIFGVILNRINFFDTVLTKKFSNIFWLIYLIVFVLTIRFGLKYSHNLDLYYQMDFEFFLFSIFFLIGWFKITFRLHEIFSESLITNYLKWLGKNVTAVYVFQWIILGNTATYLYKTLSLESALIMFVIVIFSVTLSTYLYNLSRS